MPVKIKEIAFRLLAASNRRLFGWFIFKGGWRFFAAAFLFFSLLTGIGPLEIFNKGLAALTGEVKKVELYPVNCGTASSSAVDGGWLGAEKTAGLPDIGEDGRLVVFSDANSAFYARGLADMVCGQFRPDYEKLNVDSEKSSDPTASLRDNFGQIESARIRLSAALGRLGPAEKSGKEIVSLNNKAEAIATNTGAEMAATSVEEAAEMKNKNLESINEGGVVLGEAEVAPDVSVIEPIEPRSVEIIKDEAGGEAAVMVEPAAGSEIEAVIPTEIGQAETATNSAPISFLDVFDLLKKRAVQAEDWRGGYGELVIWYSLSDRAENQDKAEAGVTAEAAGPNELWQELRTIPVNNDFSNFLHGGYLSFDAPFLKNWEDVENLKIKIEGRAAGQAEFQFYLDSLFVEALYRDERRESPAEKRARWEKMLEEISGQQDFALNDLPEMKFRYKKNRRTLVQAAAEFFNYRSFWQDVDISAEIEGLYGEKITWPVALIFEESGDFTVRLSKLERQFKPGKYKVNFIIRDRSAVEMENISLSQNFTWGVLAVNANKSIYLPGETAYLQMAVLDDLGHTLCGAGLAMEITAPDGGLATLSTANGLIVKNPECGPDNVIDTPDYFAHYQVSGAGNYQIRLTAETPQGQRTVEDQFEVRGSVPFDIERQGPTRIYPKADYAMKIKIRANEDFSGEIAETVPESFGITDYELRIANSHNKNQDAIRHFESVALNGEKIIKSPNINLKSGDEVELVYRFDAPDVSPEFYLLGPFKIGNFQEARQWQIASDAVQNRAKSVQFLGGTWSGTGAGSASTIDDSDTNQSFPAFAFRLAENSASIKNAYVLLEAQFESYTNNTGHYAGSSMAFDACSGPCSPNAWTGTSSVVRNDATVIAYDESEANQVRLLLDVTSEAQLAAYNGNGGIMTGQIGYRFNRGTAVNSISYANAVLILTYVYDKNSSPNITNTVIYPLESVDSAGGTKATSTADDCVLNSTCPLFNYNMSIPEFATTTGSQRLSQWYQMTEVANGGLVQDTSVNANIQGADIDINNFVHETALSDQTNLPKMIFASSSAFGYLENTGQQLEYRAITPTNNPIHYLIGGEVVETYTSSSSAAVKTRTVSYPIGIINTGLTNATTSASVDVYFPENGLATGTVQIKKAWLRVNSNNRAAGLATTTISVKVGANATSTDTQYTYNVGTTTIKPSFDIYHIISLSNYAELENANAIVARNIKINTTNTNNTTQGGLTAELMITYTYTNETKGYNVNLNLYGGQMAITPATSANNTAANLVFPENSGKTMRAASMNASYLMSRSTTFTTTGMFTTDVNIATTAPACVDSFNIGFNGYNSTGFLNKTISAANLGTTDNQALYSCYSNNGAGATALVGKMNAFLNYTYNWADTPPTAGFISTSTKTDGSGAIDLAIQADDIDKDDLRVKLEYAAGTACNFSTAGDPYLDETDASATSTYGDAKIDNNSPYQIGTSSGWLITSSGANTVNFDWLSKNNLSEQEGYYCLRLTANDQVYDQLASATTTVYLDNKNPSAPGALSFNKKTGTNIVLNFGATSTETNFSEYKIFYKAYDGLPPTEADASSTRNDDPNLGDQFFNGAATTTIGGLTAGVRYSFSIWTYDVYGNKASSSPVDIVANDAPTGILNAPTQDVNGLGIINLSIEVDDLNNSTTTRAKIEYVPGADCDFGSPLRPTLNEETSSISATFGMPKIDNAAAYQVGTSTGWITVLSGANTVDFDWLAKNQLGQVDGTYCLRLTANDLLDDQLAVATTTLAIDTTLPTDPGNLLEGGKTTNSITLVFGVTSTESHFSSYRIFYRQGTSGVVELTDPEVSDPDLGDRLFNGTASTTVGGLDSDTNYVFKIWAYDIFGNKASSSETVIRTNSTVTNDSLVFVNPEMGNVAVANGTSEWTFRATVSEMNGFGYLASTTLRLADAQSAASPFGDLAFLWNQSTNQFSEIGVDALGAAQISQNSSSACAANTCVLDFKIIFNHKFATSSLNYAAELWSYNDVNKGDHDAYSNFYQAKRIKVEQVHYRWRKDDGGE